MDNGYSVIKVKGRHIEDKGTDTEKEVGEKSFFVANIKTKGDDGGSLEKNLINLGKLYDQDSILSVRYNKPGVLIGTSDRDNAWPGLGQTVTVGKPVFGDAEGEFFSRKFAFEDAIELENTTSVMGAWARKKLARKSQMN